MIYRFPRVSCKINPFNHQINIISYHQFTVFSYVYLSLIQVYRTFGYPSPSHPTNQPVNQPAALRLRCPLRRINAKYATKLLLCAATVATAAPAAPKGNLVNTWEKGMMPDMLGYHGNISFRASGNGNAMVG